MPHPIREYSPRSARSASVIQQSRGQARPYDAGGCARQTHQVLVSHHISQCQLVQWKYPQPTASVASMCCLTDHFKQIIIALARGLELHLALFFINIRKPNPQTFFWDE